MTEKSNIQVSGGKTSDSASYLRGYVGRQATYTGADAFSIQVKILDARQLFGRTEFFVTPQPGEGSKWVSSRYIQIEGVPPI